MSLATNSKELGKQKYNLVWTKYVLEEAENNRILDLIPEFKGQHYHWLSEKDNLHNGLF